MTDVEGHVGSLLTDDGIELFTYRWSSPRCSSAPVVIAHGYGEHCGRYEEFARYLVGRGHPVHAFDMRGHGNSPGQRGHIDPYRLYTDDLDRFFRSVQLKHRRPCVLLGHSHGGLLALLSIDRAEIKPAGVILSCPMVALHRRHRPVPYRLAYALARLAPRLGLSNGLDVSELTHDAACAQEWANSPLNHGRTSLSWYAGALAAMHKAKRCLTKVTMPSLVLAAELDPIVDSHAVAIMASRLPAVDREFHVCAGAYHEPLNELDRASVYARIGDWLAARFSA